MSSTRDARRIDSLRYWLRNVDDSGSVDRYLRAIGQHYNSPNQVLDSYTVVGERGVVFDPQFFEDVGIENVRHQRLFQQWFETELESRARNSVSSTVVESPSRDLPGPCKEVQLQIGARNAIAETAAGNAPSVPRVRRTWRGAGTTLPVATQSVSSEKKERTHDLRIEPRLSEDESSQRAIESGQDWDSDNSYSRQCWLHGGWWDQGYWSGSDYGSWNQSRSGAQWWDNHRVSPTWPDQVVDIDDWQESDRGIECTKEKIASNSARRLSTPLRDREAAPVGGRAVTPIKSRDGDAVGGRSTTPLKGLRAVGNQMGKSIQNRSDAQSPSRGVSLGRERKQNRPGAQSPSQGASSSRERKQIRPDAQAPSPGASSIRERNHRHVPKSAPIIETREGAGHLVKWLESLGGGGVLTKYQLLLEDFFDTPEQVFLAYTTPNGDESSPPTFDRGFFQEIGVEDDAHQRLFQRWFRAQLDCRRTGTSSDGHQVAKANAQQDQHDEAKPSRSESATPTIVGGNGISSEAKARAGRVSEQGAVAASVPQPKASFSSQVETDTGGAKVGTEGNISQSESVASETEAASVSRIKTVEESDSVVKIDGNSNALSSGQIIEEREEKSLLTESVSGDSAKPLELADDSNVIVTSPKGLATSSSSQAKELSIDASQQPHQPHLEEKNNVQPKIGGTDGKSDDLQIPADLISKLRQIKECSSALPDPDARLHAGVVLLGHAGTGKSSLFGGLLRVTGAWDTRRLEKHVKDLRQTGDVLETRTEYCFTENRRFTLLDPPGQRRCAPEACCAIAQADIAVLVISASAGELEASVAKGGQMRERAALAKSTGIEHLLVAVNKMDTTGNGKWSQLRFEEARSHLCSALKAVGFQEDQLTFVPISATTGDNLSGGLADSEDEEDDLCEKCADWYSGGSLLEVLDNARLSARDTRSPLRISITGHETRKGSGVVFSGRVEQGTVEVGGAVVVVPSATVCGIQSVQVGEREVARARAGELVSLRLVGAHPNIGNALSSLGDPVRATSKFKAKVRFLELCDDVPVITPGFRCMLHLHAVSAECEMSKLIEAMDPRSKKKECPPKFVRAPMVALCVFVLTQGAEIPADSGSGRFARFSLRSDGGTIALGQIAELPKIK